MISTLNFDSQAKFIALQFRRDDAMCQATQRNSLYGALVSGNGSLCAHFILSCQIDQQRNA
ncbi:hypothetical protein QE436_001721 [Pantoea anthophila]|nr:hypothetical protein [Pantoea anthophila]